MCKLNKKSGNKRIDPCMKNLINYINGEVVACCCGHHKYPMTIVCRARNGICYELMTMQDLPRKRRFYKKDKQGYYYIPETIE